MTEELTSARIALLGFDLQHKGQKLLQNVLSIYLTEWWGSKVTETVADANILLINEDISILDNLVQSKVVTRPVVLLTTSRGDEVLSSAISSFEGLGGFCRIVFKPCRPSHIHASIKDCLKTATLPLEPSRESSQYYLTLPPATPQTFMSDAREPPQLEPRKHSFLDPIHPSPGELLQRRRSMDYPLASPRRPSMTRSMTQMPTSLPPPPSQVVSLQLVPGSESRSHGTPPLHDESSTQLSMLELPLKPRVLVVEDNDVNRTLLVQWLKKQVCMEN